MPLKRPATLGEAKTKIAPGHSRHDLAREIGRLEDIDRRPSQAASRCKESRSELRTFLVGSRTAGMDRGRGRDQDAKRDEDLSRREGVESLLQKGPEVGAQERFESPGGKILRFLVHRIFKDP
jgi:hypothetical protein